MEESVVHIYTNANLAIPDKWNLGVVYRNNKGKIEIISTWNQRGHESSSEAESQAISNALDVAKKINAKEVFLYTYIKDVVKNVNQTRSKEKVEDCTNLGRQMTQIDNTLEQLNRGHITPICSGV